MFPDTTTGAVVGGAKLFTTTEQNDVPFIIYIFNETEQLIPQTNALNKYPAATFHFSRLHIFTPKGHKSEGSQVQKLEKNLNPHSNTYPYSVLNLRTGEHS